MSFQGSYYRPPVYQGQIHNIHQIIPTYVVKSDYLPSNKVNEVIDAPSKQWYHKYEEQKRRGRIFSQRPVEFNPSRYRSVKILQNVKFNQPINEEQFKRLISRR